ncbi:MAG: thermonuclease family protein [Kordiimonadaceae bacterium]|nr:thermonuclease family protein [Kordiimonadaceae bacterium]MBO6568499.1 thermonuclease family protein [Kordiimonadaceae bacterium]MBO6963772.1 thermonuclease family protein [Kordiimonadaceae bacterium]
MVKTFAALVSLVAAVLAQPSAHAVPIPLSLKACGQFTVAEAVSGDELVAADGSHLVLSAIKAPEVWQATDQYRSWPHAEKSRAILDELVSGQKLALFCEAEDQTLVGKKIAHALVENGHWLQHQLVIRGAAMVLPRAGHVAGLDSLRAAEAIARTNKTGLWSAMDLERNAVDDIRTGRLVIVSGRVQNAAKVGNRIFLNFGENWRTDFTVEIPTRAIRLFKKLDIDPLELTQKQVEVRGWVTWRGGPFMRLEGPGQLVILSNP